MHEGLSLRRSRRLNPITSSPHSGELPLSLFRLALKTYPCGTVRVCRAVSRSRRAAIPKEQSEVCTLRKCQPLAGPDAASLFYFGQPSAGFFFCSDCLIAFFQFPRILSTSGLGPGADLAFFDCFVFDIFNIS
jgi:hypothetical protein